LAKKYLNKSSSISSHPENKWRSAYEKGRIYEHEGKTDSAFLSYLKAIEIIEAIRGKLSIEEFRSSYTEDKQFVYNKLIMLLLGSNNRDDFPGIKNSPETEAFYFSERAKARAFLDMLGNTEVMYKLPADSNLLREEYRLRVHIQNLSKEIQKSDIGYYDRESMERELNTIRKDYNDILQRIKLQNKDYSYMLSVQPENPNTLRKQLNKDDVIIQYWFGEDKLAVWIITDKTLHAKLIDTNIENLKNQLKESRKAINPYGTDQSYMLLNELYGILLKPFEKQIAKKKSLIIIPHHTLHFLPFHALINDKNEFLSEKFYISYAPSASVLSYCKSNSKGSGNKFLGMALGDLSLGGYSGLPGTKHELEQITFLFDKPTTTFKERSTESFIKEQAGDYDILHFATHGILNERMPMYSYLLFSPDDKNDGMLTVDEIFSLNLNSKLVTLSACETGLGKLNRGDELIGLSRAFVYAGSPAVIVSLWPVDDVSTAYIMTKMYQYYSSGYALDESLAFAQRSLYEKNFRLSSVRGVVNVQWNKEIINKINSGSQEMKSNPFFWAPFIIIGLPD
jgi:CHAT domain-containing protein